ncbi:MAG TPA: glycosyltransferase family 87 protein [Candidatus Sulfotelmatobacter sp.]
MNSKTIEKAAYALLTGTLLIHAFLFWQERSLIAKGYPDFTIFYSAGLMVRQGLGHQLYDDVLQYRIQRGFAPGVEIRHGNLPYNHPPFEALFFVPLTFLPYLPAYVTWNLLNLGMLGLIPRLLRPHIAILKQKPVALWVLGLLAFFPISFGLLQGQDVILLLLLQTLAFAALKRDSDFLAGCWLGLGSFKYHLILPLMVVIWLGWKRTKVFLGFLAACLCLGALSVAIVGWKEAVSYPGYVLYLERVMGHGAITPANMPNLRALLEGWKVSQRFLNPLHMIILALSLALLLGAIAISRKHLDRQMDLHFALATIVGVLISYHTFSYDLTLLAIPLLTVVSLIAGSDFQWQRDWTFFMPAGLLLLTPLYILLSFRLLHLNLLAVVLFSWLWGIQHRIKAEP